MARSGISSHQLASGSAPQLKISPYFSPKLQSSFLNALPSSCGRRINALEHQPQQLTNHFNIAKESTTGIEHADAMLSEAIAQESGQPRLWWIISPLRTQLVDRMPEKDGVAEIATTWMSNYGDLPIGCWHLTTSAAKHVQKEAGQVVG